MASSRNPPDPASHVARVVNARIRPGQHLLLGLSGGLDSVVLLDLLARLREPSGFSLSAVHVNHQLSRNAGAWAAFCERLCRQYAVPLEIVCVTVSPQGESLEAAARKLRHDALLRAAADFVVLAHHLDDQAETLLLQLLRGCGVAGASAMAEENRRVLRPLLALPRRALEAYARARGLVWVEDESNLDERFDRNYLRHRLLPVVESRFPAYRTALSRASRHFAESARLLEELAEIDAAGAIEDGELSLRALAALSPPRARNLLRHYLKLRGAVLPSTVRLEEMLRQLTGARQDAAVAIACGRFEVRRFRDRVHVLPLVAGREGFCLEWRGEDALSLPDGTLAFSLVSGRGVSLARLRAGTVTLRPRQGGEHLQPDCGRPCRTLKKLLQEADVPPWQRRRLVLLYSGELLAAVVGVGVDCAFQAGPGEPGILLEWAGRMP